MQEPGFPRGSWLAPSAPRKRTRRRRTVFSAQQLRVLEKFFEGKHYGTYGERETLAAMLNLQEYQVQVWLKNRRAKERRLQRLRGQQGPGAPAAPQEPGVCAPQPAPAPAPADPAFQEDPVLPASLVLPATPVFPTGPVRPAGRVLREDPGFPEGPVLLPAAPLHHGGPGFCSLPPHSALHVFSAADTSAYSYSQAWWDPAQGDQGAVPAAPAPAPAPAAASDPAPAPAPGPAEATASPKVPDARNFSPDPDFTELLSPLRGLEKPFSSPRPWYDFVGDSDVDLFQLLDVQGSPSPPCPADAAAPEGTRVCAHAGARSADQCALAATCSCAASARV